MEEFVFIAGVGRVLIYLVQNFANSLELPNFFKKLFECDLCLGFWTYFSLVTFFNINIGNLYIPLVSEVLTAGFLSYVVHLVVIGFKVKFDVPFGVS